MFDQIVFAGGGNRCWWQAGFWDRVNADMPLKPCVIAGISAGAATACMLYTRDTKWAMAHYCEALRGNRKNIYWGNLLRRRERVFPHYRIYRQALLDIYDGQFVKLKHGAPEIRIGVSHIPRWLGARSAVAAGLMAYNIDKHRNSLHPTLGRALGFRPEFVRAQDCATVEELADLLLQSACTPPLTPVLRRGGRPVLDGGMVDNVPVDGLDPVPGYVLVLVTRRYPLPQIFTMNHNGQARLYVQPSQPVPIDGWDYTHPDQMRSAYELGVTDGETFLRHFAG